MKGYYLTKSEYKATGKIFGELIDMIMRESQSIRCKYCLSKNIVKFGHYKGIQRYYCNSCNRKFVDNNALPKMKTSIDVIASALNSYYGGMSLDNIVEHISQQYGIRLTDAGVHNWVIRFTKEALNKTKELHPKVGDKWIADETVLKIGGKNIWCWDIIDAKTRYLLAIHLSQTRTTQDAKKLMEKALFVASKPPKLILTDALRAYIDGIELAFGSETTHIQSKPFADADLSTNLIERFHSTLKTRTDIIRGFDSISSSRLLLNGFVFNYNYLRPHEGINNKTPAELANIKLPYRNWAEVVKFSIPRKELHEDETPKNREYRYKVDSRNFKSAKLKKKSKKSTSTANVVVTIGDLRKM
jgi:transposase-like protein